MEDFEELRAEQENDDAQKMYQLPKNPCSIAGPMGSSVTEEMLIITKDQYDILRKQFRNEAYLLAFDVFILVRVSRRRNAGAPAKRLDRYR